MFGRRTGDPVTQKRVATQQGGGSAPTNTSDSKPVASAPAPKVEPVELQRKHSEEYYDVKTTVFNALIDTIDLTQLAKLEAAAAREEIRDIVSEIIQLKNVVMSIAEQEELLVAVHDEPLSVAEIAVKLQLVPGVFVLVDACGGQRP